MGSSGPVDGAAHQAAVASDVDAGGGGHAHAARTSLGPNMGRRRRLSAHRTAPSLQKRVDDAHPAKLGEPHRGLDVVDGAAFFDGVVVGLRPQVGSEQNAHGGRDQLTGEICTDVLVFKHQGESCDEPIDHHSV